MAGVKIDWNTKELRVVPETDEESGLLAFLSENLGRV